MLAQRQPAAVRGNASQVAGAVFVLGANDAGDGHCVVSSTVPKSLGPCSDTCSVKGVFLTSE